MAGRSPRESHGPVARTSSAGTPSGAPASPAVPPRLAGDVPRPARWSAVTGRTRPVLLGRGSRLFFRRLTGDVRVNAVEGKGTRSPVRASTGFPGRGHAPGN